MPAGPTISLRALLWSVAFSALLLAALLSPADVDGVTIPLLFTALMATLAHHLTHRREDRDLPWAALLAHQASFTLMAARWASDGL